MHNPEKAVNLRPFTTNHATIESNRGSTNITKSSILQQSMKLSAKFIVERAIFRGSSRHYNYTTLCRRSTSNQGSLPNTKII